MNHFPVKGSPYQQAGNEALASVEVREATVGVEVIGVLDNAPVELSEL